ncbi:AraC family transcriptional regulator [Maricurvus nonylphenolicus]|uniref:AraC family transcriptional regulator n=1 Tax=Maricurvus nonylphenolicus TaxID=1008307 RepID=UPI0036F443DF
MTATHNISIIGSWLTLFVNTLQSYGIDGPAFLAQRGIDYSAAADPTRRISLLTMTALWNEAAELVGDDEIGLKAGTFVTPTTFSSLGIALWSSCSLRDMVECWCRYLHVFSTAADMELEEHEDKLIAVTRLRLDENGQSPSSIYALDATMSALHTMSKNHFQQPHAYKALELSRPTPKHPEHFEAFFGCPVTFNCKEIRLEYDRAAAERPIPGGNPILAKETEKLVIDYLASVQLQPASTHSLLPQVRQALFELLPRGEANLDDVAAQLHISPRTLHRKLEEQDTNFRQLLEEVRKQLALDYIRQPHLSIGEISFLLGFASNSNFSRAFKRWTGQSPQEYRASRQ